MLSKKNWFEIDITEERIAMYKELLGQSMISPLEIEFMCRVESRIKGGDDLTEISGEKRIPLIAPRKTYMVDMVLSKWQEDKLVEIFINERKSFGEYDKKYGVSYVTGFDERLRKRLIEKLK